MVTAACNNNSTQIFRLLYQTKAEPRPESFLIKDADGNILSNELECLKRWKDHFSQLLRHFLVTTDHDVSTPVESTKADTDCIITPITEGEEQLKNGKAWQFTVHHHRPTEE